MAVLPTVQDLGPRPVPRSSRSIATVRNAGAAGTALAEAGVTLNQVTERLEEIHDESDIRALDAANDEEARQIRERALEARGVDAAAARVRANEELAALNERTLAAARSNRSRNALARIVSARINAERDTIGRHALNENVNVLDAQYVARRDQYVRRAEESWDQPQQAEESLAVALNEVAGRGRFRGWSPEQTEAERRTTESAVRAAIVQRMISAGDYDGALAYLDTHRDRIDHEAENELRVAIRGPMIEDEAEALVARLPSITGEATPGTPAPPQAAGQNPRFVDSFSQYHGGPGSGPGAPRRYRGGLHAANARDYPTPMNTPLRAELDWELAPSPRPRDGGRSQGEDRHGKWFSVRYSDGSTHIFRHVSTFPTRQSGRAGEEMARSGNSGIGSSGPHTHRESWTADGQGIDPQAYIDRSRGTSPQRVAGSNAPTGRVIDYAAARAEIEAMNLPRDLRRAALTALDRRVSAEDRVFEREGAEAARELAERLTEISAGGGRLTRLSQIDAALLVRLRRYRPDAVLQIQNTIEANNRPREPEANSPLMASLLNRAANDPNGFLRDVNPELYRGRVTDGEVMSLHQMRITIQNRDGPQPSQILSMIRFVLPETGIVPTNVPRGQRQGGETEAQARGRLSDAVTAQIFSGVQERLSRNFPRGTQPTETDILDAVRAETSTVYIGGQAMRAYEARRRPGGLAHEGVVIPDRALPYIDQVLRAAGRPVNGAERIREYNLHRSRYDAR